VAYKNVLNQKGRLKIYAVPSHVAKLFAIVGLDRVFDYYETEEEALKSFKEERVFSEILKKQLRRRFKRVPIQIPLEYKQKISTQDTFWRGKVLNLSAIGAFVIAERIFPIGELLTTRMYLMPKPGVIDVDAKVVWVADEEIQPLESPAMGLEFYDISTEMQEKIIGFVEKHLTHTPQE
jgi:c-di-GMP-binding flagellar brake protein YcgR